jgi:hypothetical protein
MLKKTPHKRKVKYIIRRILLLFLLFSFTFSSLVLLYGLLYVRKHKLTSPLAIMQQTMHTFTSSDDYTKKIQNALEKNAIATSSITAAEGNTTLVTLKEGGEIIFANSKDITQQLASLQLIERQLTIEGRRFHRIDFRFDNPVVTF